MCNVEGPPLKKRKPQPLNAAEPLPLYLDYNATTPLCEEAWQAMCGVHTVWGNPSSSHPYGLAAKYALDQARDKVCRALHAPSTDSIIFTSGGTESNNLAIVGGALQVNQADPSRRFIITTNVEHPAVVEVVKFLQSRQLSAEAAAIPHQPLEFRMAPVNERTGQLDVATLRATLEALPGGPKSAAVVTVMFANNELGSVNPIADLVRATKELAGTECVFHSDAAQALGKVPVDVSELQLDLLSVCGHKFYAPKGVGALYVKPGVQVRNILFGAGHERGVRPGTENVLLATGMAVALLYAVENLDTFAARMRAARDELARELRKELAEHNMDFEVNGDLSVALPNTLNCAIFKRVPDKKAGLPSTYISAQRLILAVGDQVCMSAGSACHSTAGDEEIEVSGPLKGVGVTLERAIGTLRLSTGRDTTVADARRGARIIARHAAQQFGE